MSLIGGNTACTLLYKSGYSINAIGEKTPVESEYDTLYGFLDLSSGDSKYVTYNTKLQESDHIFVCDYTFIDKEESELTALINGKRYDVMLIDNPMGLNKHLEIYLRYRGE